MPNAAASPSGNVSGIGATRSASVVICEPNVPGPMAMTRCPTSTESTSGADGRHDAHTLATDHRRRTVKGGIDAHRLEHVTEIEARGGNPDLDLAGCRRNPFHRMHFQRIQASGLIDLQPHGATGVQVHHGAASFADEITGRRGGRGHQSVDIAMPVAQRDLVVRPNRPATPRSALPASRGRRRRCRRLWYHNRRRGRT